MDTAQDVRADLTPVRRRRWPKVVALGFIAALLLAFVVTTAVLERYRPLETGSLFGSTGNYREPETYGERPVRLYPYQAGGRFTYYFSVRNHGPWAVTITDVLDRARPEDDWLIVDQALLLGGYSRHGEFGFQGRAVRFRPFSLAPDEERVIGFQVRFDHCARFGPGRRIEDSKLIAYRILGIEHQMQVPMSVRIVIEAPPPGQCPESAGN